jgi:hypothetical protein
MREQAVGELRDREDEDEIEEQLDRRDGRVLVPGSRATSLEYLLPCAHDAAMDSLVLP